MGRDLHKVQASILRELLFKNGTNFSSLNKSGLTNDHFTFHINQLTNKGIIEKKRSKYYLTQKGKVFSSKLDVDALVMERQATLSVAVTAKKKIKGKTHLLIQKGLKEPFFGYYGFINGKVRFGETSEDTTKRELKEETGLSGDPEIFCVFHKMRGPSKSTIKLDNLFFVYLVKNIKGALKYTKEGKNFWFPEEKVRKLKTFPGFDNLLNKVIKVKSPTYWEGFIRLKHI